MPMVRGPFLSLHGNPCILNCEQAVLGVFWQVPKEPTENEIHDIVNYLN